MAEEELVQLGPWPKGINNVEDETSSVYVRVDGTGLSKDKPAQLREGVNVDLDSAGWPRRRTGRTKVATLTNGHSGVSLNGHFYYVDSGTMYELSTSDYVSRSILSGLTDSQISYDLVGGIIYWSNGFEKGTIINGEASFWGLKMPSPPAVLATSGNLLPGEYLVGITCEDITGRESGARVSSHITLGSNGGITCAFTNVDSNASFINIYVTPPNGKQLLWEAKVPVSETSYTITSVNASAIPLKLFNTHPPPIGHIVTYHSGRMLVAYGNELYWSQPLAYEHFKISTDLQMFPSRIILLESVDSGFYVATEDGSTYWVNGNDPDEWSPIKVDDALVSEQRALKLPARSLGIDSKYSGIVPVWISSRGYTIGLPDGNIVQPTEESVAMDSYSKASLAYRDSGDLKQILANTRSKILDTLVGVPNRPTGSIIDNGAGKQIERAAFGDSATITVIKAS